MSSASSLRERRWQPYAKVGDTYSLNDAERRLAEYIGRMRQGARRAVSSVNVRRNPAADDLTTHINGFAGELAFCALHNCYPDLEIGRTRPGDAIVAGGIVVDVKARPDDWDLLVMPEKIAAVTVDVYSLMIGRFPGPYRYAGSILRADIVADSHWLPDGLGYGPLWLARQSELSDIHPLYVILKQDVAS